MATQPNSTISHVVPGAYPHQPTDLTTVPGTGHTLAPVGEYYYRPAWAHGRRANRGYGRGMVHRVSLTAVHYSTYMELHLLAHKLSKGMGKRVNLNQALHHAVASALRDLE